MLTQLSYIIVSHLQPRGSSGTAREEQQASSTAHHTEQASATLVVPHWTQFTALHSVHLMLPPTTCSTTPLMLMPHNMADTPSISVTLCPMCKHTSNYSTIGLHTVYITINTNMHIYTLITMHCNDGGQCQHDMCLVTSQQMQKLKRSNNHHKHCKN